jgi:hypothetical protein
VIVCVPVPATLALKLVPVTPGPLYVPPAGEPPLKVYVVELIHCCDSNPVKVTTGKELTTIEFVAELVHPLRSVKLYVFLHLQCWHQNWYL